MRCHPTINCFDSSAKLTMHMIFLWQQQSGIPTTAEWDALYEAAPILHDEGLEMLAVCEHCMLHRNELEMAFEADNLFFQTDRENASRINGRRSSYNVGGILNDVHCIYGTGAPFERLFFEARRQLDDAIRQLGYERKEREFQKASDPRFNDYNFFEGYSRLQAALLDTEGRLDYVEKRRKAERREMLDALFASEQRV